MKKALKFILWCIVISILISVFPVFLAKKDFKKEEKQSQQIEEVIKNTESNNYKSENTLNYVNVLLEVGYTIIILLSATFWFFMILFLIAVIAYAMLDDSKLQKK